MAMTQEPEKPKHKAKGKPFGGDHRGSSGRKVGSRNVATIVRAFAQEKHKLTKHGKQVTLTTVELIFKALNAAAISGDVRASRYCDKLRSNMVPHGEVGGLLIVPETMSEERWHRFVEAHNATVVQPDPPDTVR